MTQPARDDLPGVVVAVLLSVEHAPAVVKRARDLGTEQLRADIDRLVMQAVIPERARVHRARDQTDPTDAMRAQWESVKEQWR